MNLTSHLLAAVLTMPDISAYLTKGAETVSGVTLQIGDTYVWGLLGGGPLLILAGLVLVKIMFARVKFFALEYGNGSFFGRVKIIAPFILMGTLLLLSGTAALYAGWQAQNYSVVLNEGGVREELFGETRRYTWADVTGKSDHIKSTDFWILFSKGGQHCRVRFQQRFIGEKVQDKAIVIAENGIASSPLR